jgi:hypothetical protein
MVQQSVDVVIHGPLDGHPPEAVHERDRIVLYASTGSTDVTVTAVETTRPL